jgi:hypothetical protein
MTVIHSSHADFGFEDVADEEHAYRLTPNIIAISLR